MTMFIRQVTVAILALAASLLLSSCLITVWDAHDTGSGTMITGEAIVQDCTETPDPTRDATILECDFGPDTATFIAPSLAVAAAVMFDPLVLELPATATGVTGFIVDKNAFLPFGQNLEITSGLTSIAIDAKTNLVAEPGKQLVIVDVPSGFKPTGGKTTVSFTVHYVDLTHSPVKVIFAGKLAVGGTTYYPPLVPCVTDFASVPEVSGGVTLAQLGTLLAGLTPCDHKAYDFGGGPPPPGSANYQGLWWVPNGVENFWGINFAHQGDQVFATWYTYDTSGNPWWLSMLASRTTPASNAYGGDINVDTGPPFSAYIGKGKPTKVSIGTLTFSDANNGTFGYTVNMGAGSVMQMKTLTRYVLDPATAQPVCTYAAATPNFAAATNYQDLWWVANAAEDGWGVNFARQGKLLFGTWYTYGTNGAPLWLSVLAEQVGATNAYTGMLYRTSGPRYDAYDTTKVVPQQVGMATFTFADGNHAAFDYSTTGVGGLPIASQRKQITRFPFAAAGGTLCN